MNDIDSFKAQLASVIVNAEQEKPSEYLRGQLDTWKAVLQIVDNIEAQRQFGVFLSWKALAIIAVGGIFVYLLH